MKQRFFKIKEPYNKLFLVFFQIIKTYDSFSYQFKNLYIKFMPQILQHIQHGNLKSTDLIVFLQGWPDNMEMWDSTNWKQDLKDKNLLFINFPNTNGKVDSKWGKDFPQIIEDLKYTIDSVKKTKQKVYLVAHDWGCFYGYIFDKKYPAYFSEMVMLDIPAKAELTSLKAIIYFLFYQITLVIAFLIGGKIGNFLTIKIMHFFSYYPAYESRITYNNNYPYFYLWKNYIQSALRIKQNFLKKYQPSAPVTYLYGGKKDFQFHGQKWLKMVQKSGGEYRQMDQGHWFMKKYSKQIADLILKKTQKK